MSELGLKFAVQRSTLSEQLYKLVRNDILGGQIRPGTPISEISLAKTYGVSRSPAREALAELERVGLTERASNRDRIITVPSYDMIRQKYELWWIVDVGRTYLASQAATKDDIRELQVYVDEMDRSARNDNLVGYKAACAKFHHKIRRSCPNEAVNQVGRDCDLYLDWFENLYDRYPEYSLDIVAEHESILDAYSRSDLAALSVSIRKHIGRQRDRILSYFEVFESSKSVDSLLTSQPQMLGRTSLD